MTNSISKKTLSGTVHAEGSPIIIGEVNFTSAKLSNGRYRIDLPAGFFELPPVVMLTVNGTGKGNTWTGCASVHDLQDDSFTVSVQNLSGIDESVEFNFLCIER